MVMDIEGLSKPHINRLLGPWDIFPLYIPKAKLENIDIPADFSLNPHTYQVTVPWKIIEFPEDEFVTLLKKSEKTRELYLEYLGNVLMSTEQRLVDQATLSAPKRIIHLLMQLAENKQFSNDFDGQKEIKCWLTQNDFSSLAWCSRQTFTQIINKLCDLELLSFNRNRILIYDLENLRKYLESLP